MQGGNTDADAENGHMGRVGEGEGEINWEPRIDIQTVIYVNRQLVGSCYKAPGAWGSVMTSRGGLRHWAEAPEGGAMSVLTAGSCCCLAERNTTL